MDEGEIFAGDSIISDYQAHAKRLASSCETLGKPIVELPIHLDSPLKLSII